MATRPNKPVSPVKGTSASKDVKTDEGDFAFGKINFQRSGCAGENAGEGGGAFVEGFGRASQADAERCFEDQDAGAGDGEEVSRGVFNVDLSTGDRRSQRAGV